ncbi:MAG: transcriptional regulator, partial [Lentisphaeria bacterium]|nr:zinc ribbon domain-containing protein [Lentisphaeria bacterium]NQZ68142.1 transcriptional regulator [Lentisphaeria bacterium]
MRESKDYCCYCYEKGAFRVEQTMDEMIESCIPHVIAANKEMTEN